MIKKIIFLLFLLVSLALPVQSEEDHLINLLDGEIVDFDLEILDQFLEATIPDQDDAHLVLLNLSYVAPKFYETPEGVHYYGCGATLMHWDNNTLTIFCNADHFTPPTQKIGDLFTDCILATGAFSCWGSGSDDPDTLTYWQAQDVIPDLSNYDKVPWVVYMNPVAGQYQTDDLEFYIRFKSNH